MIPRRVRHPEMPVRVERIVVDRVNLADCVAENGLEVPREELQGQGCGDFFLP